MRKKMAMMGGAVALLVALFAVPALALNFQCTRYNCYGTNASDNILERAGNNVADHIQGLRRADTINANLFRSDIDKVYGNRGPDTLYVNDADGLDLASGGPGFDRCYVDQGDATVSCEVIIPSAQ
jgi:hypothetical protein